jgi:hypothetical protein
LTDLRSMHCSALPWVFPYLASSYLTVFCRSALAALDINHNTGRAQATDADGETRWRIKVGYFL